LEKFELADIMLPFPTNPDAQHQFVKLANLISSGLDIKKLNEIDWKNQSSIKNWYLGIMTELKYNYTDRAAGGLGGARASGNFDDGTTFSMVVFDKSLYAEKKELIEELEGEPVLLSASQPNTRAFLSCHDIWRIRDIAAGDIAGVPRINAISAPKRDVIEQGYVNSCAACQLRSQCTQPVPILSGDNNLMIVGEAPGREEDKAKEPFIGRAGQLLFGCLKKKGLHRPDFWITNVCKCYPSQSKNPTTKQVDVCRKWLDKEIAAIRPVVILAAGNLARYYFTSKSSGILNANAGVEWSEFYQAFIVCTMHPSAALRRGGNKTMIESSVDSLAAVIDMLCG